MNINLIPAHHDYNGVQKANLQRNSLKLELLKLPTRKLTACRDTHNRYWPLKVPLVEAVYRLPWLQACCAVNTSSELLCSCVNQIFRKALQTLYTWAKKIKSVGIFCFNASLIVIFVFNLFYTVDFWPLNVVRWCGKIEILMILVCLQQ